jgi:nitrate reductase cytochrome c-type subunit
MDERISPINATRSNTLWRVIGLLVFILVVGGLAVAGATGYCWRTNEPPLAEQPDKTGPALFTNWPKDAKPSAAIMLSGQTFGYLQPCGCSRPQFGGLERRANFVAGLKAKGWPVAAVDLGDVYPHKGPVREQDELKYTTAMNALREMGYVAVGMGKTEFAHGTLNVLAQYSLQKEQPPYLLAGNVVGVANGKTVPRETFFPPAQPGGRALIGLAEVADISGVPVGIVGVVGKNVAVDATKTDPLIDFLDVKETIGKAVAGLSAHPKKPRLNILLYQGTSEHARLVAKDWPQFQIILCQADDSEPPQFPDVVDHPGGGKTLVIQVGHKGRYVGLVGAFKKADGSFDLKYQLVSLSEDYLTPNDAAAEKANPALARLEDYAKQVKDRNFLAKVPQVPHPAQIQAADLNLTYIGSEKCASCHQGENIKWAESKHSHALEALEKVAKRPGLRNFDGECVVCHVVGLGYKTGFESVEKTPHLKHVGCENCHGPGSGHASAPNNLDLQKLMSPWKQEKTDRLPDVPFLEKLAAMNPVERGAVQIPPVQQRVMNAVTTACMKCHDPDNDPHFDLYKYWPKIVHGPPPKK